MQETNIDIMVPKVIFSENLINKTKDRHEAQQWLSGLVAVKKARVTFLNNVFYQFLNLDHLIEEYTELREWKQNKI